MRLRFTLYQRFTLAEVASCSLDSDGISGASTPSPQRSKKVGWADSVSDNQEEAESADSFKVSSTAQTTHNYRNAHLFGQNFSVKSGGARVRNVGASCVVCPGKKISSAEKLGCAFTANCDNLFFFRPNIQSEKLGCGYPCPVEGPVIKENPRLHWPHHCRSLWKLRAQNSATLHQTDMIF